jgi:AcrR family transcriptional regulator
VPASNRPTSRPTNRPGAGEARDRLRAAAFALFEERGYDATTVGDIAEAAGVGRTTFFRAFGSKEDVIFPEHTALLERVRSRLETATAPGAATLIGIAEATRLVLEHYLHEGDLARARYRLTRTVTTLRDRELASTLQYHRVYRDALRAWTGEEAGRDLRAELLAAAVVTAHNHVLRRWLRGVFVHCTASAEELALALEEALGTGPSGALPRPADEGTSIVVLRTPYDVDAVLPALRRALADGAPR